MSVSRIEQAVQRALDCRGTVMLAARDDERQWCAVCAAVDGTVEVRVGEPPSGWRHRGRRRRGEAWLRDRGFVQVIDAWAKPMDATSSTWTCAETLDHARRSVQDPHALLLRVEDDAGHDGNNRQDAAVARLADQYAFLMRELGMRAAP